MYFKYEAEGRRLAGEREPERQRERGEESEPVCVCERERDLIRSQCPAGSGPGDVSTPITCLQTHHQVASTTQIWTTA
jgi:hypothetical protein